MDEYRLSPEALEDLKARGEKWAEGFRKSAGWLPLENVSGWIKVSDRLPEEGRRVLVYRGGCKFGPLIEVGFLRKNEKGGNKWLEGYPDDTEEYHVRLWCVTHWCELPDLPTE